MTLKTLKNRVSSYLGMLTEKEMSDSTIKKYSLGIRTFLMYMENENKTKNLQKEDFILYKNHLEKRYKPNTINLYIAGLNSYLKFLKHADLCVKSLNTQRKSSLENCLTNTEYHKMLKTAKNQQNDIIYHVIRTLACTGIRVSGLNHITVSAIEKGSIITKNKGKMREIVIPEKVCEELKKYCVNRGIIEGCVFHLSSPNKTIHRTTVLRWLKKMAILAGVDESKAFPHNLRHLFAKNYIEKYGNLSELADILGHSKIETTRIYTRTSIEEKRGKMNNLEL